MCCPFGQMNPWVYTLPHGEGKELDMDSLTYKDCVMNFLRRTIIQDDMKMAR